MAHVFGKFLLFMLASVLVGELGLWVYIVFKDFRTEAGLDLMG
jgi:hypothetical protein